MKDCVCKKVKKKKPLPTINNFINKQTILLNKHKTFESELILFEIKTIPPLSIPKLKLYHTFNKCKLRGDYQNYNVFLHY